MKDTKTGYRLMIPFKNTCRKYCRKYKLTYSVKQQVYVAREWGIWKHAVGGKDDQQTLGNF
jgi:hypothetical protein